MSWWERALWALDDHLYHRCGKPTFMRWLCDLNERVVTR